MSKIKELVDKVRSTLSAEEAEKIDESLIELVTVSKTMETELTEAQSDVKTLRKEGYERRHENKTLKDLQAEWEVEKETLNGQVTELTSQVESAKDNPEFKNLQEFKNKTLGSQRVNIKQFYETYKDHDKFELVKTKFSFPLTEEGEIDSEKLEKMEIPEVEKNITAINDLNGIKYFDEPSGKDNKNKSGFLDSKGQRGADKSFEERVGSAKSDREVKEMMKEATTN